MIKRILQAISLSIILSFSAHAGNTYSQVYIFGDSLSDTGNLASVIGEFPFPYYMNRVSNGPVAVDVMSEMLGLDAQASLYLLGMNAGGNYAVAGARASGADAIDLDTQLLSFMVNHGFSAPSDALYVIFIGGNDLRDLRMVADKATVSTGINASLEKISQAIQQLNGIGAKHFFVINAPDIGVIPETRLIDQAIPDVDVARQAEKISKQFRVGVHETVERIEGELMLDIKEFDLYKYFNKLIKHADASGFTNTTDACFSSVSYTFNPDCNYGQSADQFIFFDEIHPTRRVHEMIGSAFYEVVR